MTTTLKPLNIKALETEAAAMLARARRGAMLADDGWYYGEAKLINARIGYWTVTIDCEINEDLSIIYYFDDSIEQIATDRLDEALKIVVTMLKWELGE